MDYTEKYCDECARKLSPDDGSPQDQAFLHAVSLKEGMPTSYNTPCRDAEGTCHKCGKNGPVLSYPKLS